MRFKREAPIRRARTKHPSAAGADADQVYARRVATRSEYRAATAMNFATDGEARAVVDGIVARANVGPVAPHVRGFQLHYAASLAAKLVVARYEGKWGPTPAKVMAAEQRLVVTLHEQAIECEEQYLTVCRAARDRDAARKSARRIGRWAQGYALDLAVIGLDKSLADAASMFAFTTAAEAYHDVAQLDRSPEARGLALLDAAVMHECAASRAAALGDESVREAELDRAELSAFSAGNWLDEAAQATPDAVNKLERLELSVLCFAYRNSLHAQRIEAAPGTHNSANSWYRAMESDARAALVAFEDQLLASGDLTERQLVAMHVRHGARIINRIDGNPRRRAWSAGETQNCQRVVACGLALGRGGVVVAPALTPGSAYRNDVHKIYGDAYGRTFVDVAKPDIIRDALERIGPGAKGVVHVQRSETNGHVCIAENINGTVYFLEYQNGTLHDLTPDGSDIGTERDAKYAFMLTHDALHPESLLSADEEVSRARAVLSAIEAKTRAIAPPILTRRTTPVPVGDTLSR